LKLKVELNLKLKVESISVRNVADYTVLAKLLEIIKLSKFSGIVPYIQRWLLYKWAFLESKVTMT